ncbi:hypothetical protein BDV39DRAFT_39690 [Aspergillus sergii]|uniref:Uncharacterized protein n=1 Tax=Aspergillus sergii TaxID=1034303 RepID=A0A5N6X9I3_9EURO|nr:hypothetical protein BDV39DRAFT_39690 [Aspergillus sergii]
MHVSPKTIKVFAQDVERWDRMTKLWYSFASDSWARTWSRMRRRAIGTTVRPINEDIGMLRGFHLLVYVRQALLQAVRNGILVSSHGTSPFTPPMTRQHHMHPSNTSKIHRVNRHSWRDNRLSQFRANIDMVKSMGAITVHISRRY